MNLSSILKLNRQSSKEKRNIPMQVDPVLNYPLPPLKVFITDLFGLHFFFKTLNGPKMAPLFSCYSLTMKFEKEPSKEAADVILKDCENGNFLSTQLLQKIKMEIYEEGCFTDPHLFDQLQDSLLGILEPEWSKFRSKQQFKDYLEEAKGIYAIDLEKQWWKKNKHTKWANQGKKANPLARKKGFELVGNAITKPGILPQNRTQLEGKYVMVFWELDNSTRVCHLLLWNPDKEQYRASYLFNGKLYDEALDCDWQLIDIEEVKVDDLGAEVTGSSDSYSHG